MGLTIYYTLDLSGDQPESRALEWVQTLREAAVTLGAKPVTSVLRVVRSDCERLDSEKLDLEWLVRCFAIRGVEDPRDPQRFLNVLPDLAFGFGAMIGRCEPVVLGLGRHPATVTDSGIEVTTEGPSRCWMLPGTWVSGSVCEMIPDTGSTATSIGWFGRWRSGIL